MLASRVPQWPPPTLFLLPAPHPAQTWRTTGLDNLIYKERYFHWKVCFIEISDNCVLGHCLQYLCPPGEGARHSPASPPPAPHFFLLWNIVGFFHIIFMWHTFLYYYFKIRMFSGNLFAWNFCWTCIYGHSLKISQLWKVTSQKVSVVSLFWGSLLTLRKSILLSFQRCLVMERYI